jgi:hypothetical protein
LGIVFFLAAVGVLCPQRARAEFRGDEIEDRTWNYSSRYFFKVLVFEMPWRWEGVWRGEENGYRIELGSVMTDEFYIYQEAKLAQVPANWLRLGFRYYQEEDFDARFQRHRIEAEFFPHGQVRPGVYAEVDPFKEWLDVGAKVHGLLPNLWEGWLALTLVDAVYNRKGAEGTYEKVPITLAHASRVFLIPGHLSVDLACTLDLPLTLDLPDDGFVFRFQRSRWSAGVAAEWKPGWELRFRIGAEWAYKKRNYEAYTPPDPKTNRFDRDAGFARVEAVRFWKRPEGFEEGFTAGFRWFQLFERWRYPHMAVNDRRLWKRDFVGYGTARLIVSSPLYMEGKIFVGRLEHLDHYTHQPDLGRERYYPCAVRIGYFLGFWFAHGVEIVPFLYVEGRFERTDAGIFVFATEFGGGGVNAIITF